MARNENSGIWCRCFRVQSGKESVSRRKGCDPACPGKLGRGNQEERTADQGSIILPPHIGQQYSCGDGTGTECPVRCDICRSAIYAAGFCSGNLAGESDEKYCFCG